MIESFLSGGHTYGPLVRADSAEGRKLFRSFKILVDMFVSHETRYLQIPLTAFPRVLMQMITRICRYLKKLLQYLQSIFLAQRISERIHSRRGIAQSCPRLQIILVWTKRKIGGSEIALVELADLILLECARSGVCDASVVEENQIFLLPN
jgi:hypothetical protein